MNPNTNQTEMSVYGSNATYKSEPINLANGHVPLDTLPAAWWNWLWNQITKNNNASLVSIENMRDELKNVLDAAGITPSELSDNQLYSAIEIIRKRVATVSDPGAVLSSSDLKSVSVGNDGLVLVNALADWTESVTIKAKLDALTQALEDGYKPKQTAVADPTADDTETTVSAIDTISQDENGVITPTKKNIRAASTTEAGIVQLNDTLTSTSTTQALTAAQGKALADAIASAGSPEFRYSTSSNDSIGTNEYLNFVFNESAWASFPADSLVAVIIISFAEANVTCTPAILYLFKNSSGLPTDKLVMGILPGLVTYSVDYSASPPVVHIKNNAAYTMDAYTISRISHNITYTANSASYEMGYVTTMLIPTIQL